MSVDIRVPPPDTLRAWADAVEVAFGEQMTAERWPGFERILEPGRTLAAYDGDRIVGGGSIFSFRLTVPGGAVPAAGLTAVGVQPTHRRQGILRRLMRQWLVDSRDRGEPVAILWASEGGIYQRFGYGLASMAATVTAPQARGGFREPIDPEGAVRLVDRDEAARAFPPIYDRVLAATPGFYSRSPDWWAVERLDDPESRRNGAGPKFYVLFEADGGPEGYVMYRIRGEWDWTGSKSTLEIVELMGATPRAVRELWRFCFAVDLIATVRAPVQRPDHPLLHMVAEPRRLALTVGDALWLRLLDVPAALSARSYRGAGSVVLDVADRFMPEWAGRWRLEVDDGRGRVTPTADPPDLMIDTTDLAAVYLGDATFAQLERAGRGRPCTAGATARTDDLFATDQRPWCPQVF